MKKFYDTLFRGFAIFLLLLTIATSGCESHDTPQLSREVTAVLKTELPFKYICSMAYNDGQVYLFRRDGDTDWWEYDLATSELVDHGVLPMSGRVTPFSVNEELFVMGNDTENRSGIIMKLDSESKTWSEVASCSTKLSYSHYLFTLDGKFYFKPRIGVPFFWYFDPVTNEIYDSCPDPSYLTDTNSTYYPIHGTPNGRGYIIHRHCSIQEYNPDNATWMRVKTLNNIEDPYATIEPSYYPDDINGFAIGHNICFFSGGKDDNGNIYSTVNVWDLLNKEIFPSKIRGLILSDYDYANCVVAGNKVYVAVYSQASKAIYELSF